MDISLPVSDSSAAGAFSGGASTRSVDSGKFSQALSKQMSGPAEDNAGTSKETVTQPSQSQTTATTDATNGSANADQPDAATDGTAESAGHMQDPAAPAKKSTSEPKPTAAANAQTKPQAPIAEQTKSSANAQSAAAVIAADITANKQNEVISADELDSSQDKTITKKQPAKIHELTDGQELASASETTASAPDQQADNRSKIVTAEMLANDIAQTLAPAVLDKLAANPVLNNGVSSPALLRSSALHNEAFNSVRAQRAEALLAEAGTAAEGLLSGKSLQGSGKSPPASAKLEKTENQLNSFLPAGAQDWKSTADALITAVSDKSAKFEALGMQFDSKSTEAFSLVNTGSGKFPLSPQTDLKSELASPADTYTSLKSDFLAGSDEWCQDFGSKIEWLNNENITKAELSLHPAELGALDITINTDDDRISINIVAHSEKAREMLEGSLPRLTELLKSQGLALENSNISHNSFSEKQNAHPQQQAHTFNLAADDNHGAELDTVRSAMIRHQGQIDHYV